MSDPKPFIIPAGTLKRGTVLKLDLRDSYEPVATIGGPIIFDNPRPLPGGYAVTASNAPTQLVVRQPPTRFQAAVEARARLIVAYRVIEATVDVGLNIMALCGGVPAETTEKRAEMQQAFDKALLELDRRLAILLRPVCPCGWPWSDEPECPGCGEARAPDGRSVPTCEAELEATTDDERQQVRAEQARLRDRGMV